MSAAADDIDISPGPRQPEAAALGRCPAVSVMADPARLVAPTTPQSHPSDVPLRRSADPVRHEKTYGTGAVTARTHLRDHVLRACFFSRPSLVREWTSPPWTGVVLR